METYMINGESVTKEQAVTALNKFMLADATWIGDTLYIITPEIRIDKTNFLERSEVANVYLGIQ